MVSINSVTIDPTLTAVDEAIEANQDKSQRPYLGASSIGDKCERKLWMNFRWVSPPDFEAHTLKKFADGHATEDIQASRLRLVTGIELWTHEATGRQFGFIDLNGHFRGHYDGLIRGLLQAPKTPHVWEHKCSAEPVQRKLINAIKKDGEKNALALWNETYYAQAQIYMKYTKLSRHYMTVSTPGCRETISCRTDFDEKYANNMVGKAQRIISSDRPAARISDDPSNYVCKWCDHYDLCQLRVKMPKKNCRTCMFSSPDLDGKWTCGHYSCDIPADKQAAGCDSHLFLPDLLPYDVLGADIDAHTVTYETKQGQMINCAESGKGPDAFPSSELQHCHPALIGDTTIDMLRDKFDGRVIEQPKSAK